ncbi:unnamed protein product [Rhizophagus irregularis]|nr:unnamed protein product [Rhizophagus irregularis]
MKQLRYKKYFVSTKPQLTLNHVAYNIFLQRAGISTSLVTPNTTTLPIKQISPNDPLHTIDASLICNDMIKNDLKNISTNFANYQNFHFYTDGSVKALGQQGCKSGFGWIQVSNDAPKFTFSGSTVFFPSSYKSESMALLTAIITLPYQGTAIISTDSANCIHTFNHRINTPVISPRKKLKQNNYLIWDLIFWIIHNMKLSISLQKVKAHSNDTYNDRADALANTGSFSEQPIIVNHRFFAQTSLGHIGWNNIYVVDRNVRKWADNPIQATIFNSLVNNTSLKPIHEFISNGSIDWSFTRLWIHHNPTDSPTNNRLSIVKGTKIKKSNFIYPTADILQRNYPKLYPKGVIKCVECKCKDDTATHVCLCNSHIEDINRILSTHKTKLGALLMAQSNSFTFDLSDRINKSILFARIEIDDTTSHSMIPRSLPGLLLLYNLIPTELTYLFYNYIGDKKTRESLFLKYTDDLIRELNHVTWTKRLRSFKKWEKSLNITRKDKRYYRQRFRNRHNHDVPDQQIISSTTTHSERNYSGVKYRLPYEKSLLTFNSTAHIRWTSSNFLHSGSWEYHRDELQFNIIDCSYINDVWCSLGY